MSPYFSPPPPPPPPPPPSGSEESFQTQRFVSDDEGIRARLYILQEFRNELLVMQRFLTGNDFGTAFSYIQFAR